MTLLLIFIYIYKKSGFVLFIPIIAMVTVSVLAHKRGECYTLSTVNQSGFPDDEEEKEEAANGAAAAAAADDDDDDADAASAAGLRVKFEAYIIYKFLPKYILEKRIPQTAYIYTLHFRRTRRHRCAQA